MAPLNVHGKTPAEDAPITGVSQKEMELEEQALWKMCVDVINKPAGDKADKAACETLNPLEKSLQDASVYGFDCRCMLGQRFARSAEGGKSAEYKGNREEKAKFRARWAKLELAKLLELKQETVEEVSTSELSKGRYRSFRWLCKEEGLDGARKYTSKCIKLGSPWVSKDEMFERPTFLVMEEGFDDVFRRAWRIKLSKSATIDDEGRVVDSGPAASGSGAQKGAADGAANSGGGDGDDAPPEPEIKVRKTEAKGKGKGKGKGGQPKPAEGEDVEKQKLRSIVAEANKTKVQYANATAGANNLRKVIGLNDDYAWARKPHALDEFTAAEQKLSAFISESTFAQEFITFPIGAVKKKFGDGFVAGCAAFHSGGAKLVQDLSEEINDIVSMAQSRKKRGSSKA